MTDAALVFDATTASFETEVLQRSLNTPVLVDFWAEWCGPCKALGPVLEKLAADFGGGFVLAKVNTEAERQIAAAFQIRSIPTVFLVKDGQIVDGFQGALPEGQIREFLDRHGITVNAPVDEAPAPPPAAEDEIARLRGLIADGPGQAEHALELALALIKTDAFVEARGLLDGLPANLANDERAHTARARLDFAAVLDSAPARAELEASLAAHPDDHRARHQLGVRLLLGGDSEAALDAFLEILRRDLQFDDALGKRALIDAFRIIDDAELISRIRRKMSSILF